MEFSIQTSLVVKSALARDGLRHIFASHGLPVAQAVSRIDDLDFSVFTSDHIVIFDSSLLSPDRDVAQLVKLTKASPFVRVVLLADHFEFDLVDRAFAAGVQGFFTHETPYRSLLGMLQLVALGEKVAPSELIDHLSSVHTHSADSEQSDVATLFGLCGREVAILECLVVGMPNKLISRKLGVSEATVKLNVKTIFRKMSVNNRTQAAMLARFPLRPDNSRPIQIRFDPQ
ncbi:LuxR C-terminal-related transcriptional regulator [Sphingomonas sp. IW22]|uniref:LuxR C-terminal-related transcriptional regulator n=1 Tax=Sphingomonas sp. IW22 TaxID=3242489 RepID=UPI003520691B